MRYTWYDFSIMMTIASIKFKRVQPKISKEDSSCFPSTIFWLVSDSKVCSKRANPSLGGYCTFEDYGSLEISSC